MENELIELAERVERAGEREQVDLLYAAWEARGPIECPSAKQAARFVNMMDAGAFESAAMSLVPVGVEGLPLSFKLEHFHLGNGTRKSRASVWCGLGGVSSLDTATDAATPALALCAAFLRALAAQHKER